MNEHTSKLLTECNYGCRMALESMQKILEYVEDDGFRHLIIQYMEKHEKLEKESADLLSNEGKEQKEPGAVANAFIWLTTEMKLMIKDGNHQIAKILMNGCNMGIQSISKCLNECCCHLENDAEKLAKKLIHVEEEFMKELEIYL